jgi:hypothetical protein
MIGSRALVVSQMRTEPSEALDASRLPSGCQSRSIGISSNTHDSAVNERDQDVRRLEIAVDDPLLMRVLDGTADLDEQL